jgi:RHS repeat-associated protein
MKLPHLLQAFVLSTVCHGASAQALPSPPVSAATITTFEYDAAGLLTKTVKAPGSLSIQSHTAHDKLNRVKSTTDPLGGIISISRDGREGLNQVVDPRGLITKFPRNGFGDPMQIVSPDTGTASHTHDAMGTVITRTDSRGVLETNTRDAMHRLTRRVYSKTGSSSVVHNWVWSKTGVPYGIGRLGEINYPGGLLTYSYDAQGRVVSTTQQLAATAGANAVALTHVARYQYSLGRMTALTYPSGRRLDVAWTNGLISSIALASGATSLATPLITDIKWQPFGPAKSWNWQTSAGAQAHERIYDVSGRVVRLRLGNVILDLTYDAADRIASYTHYDPTTAAKLPALQQTFSYDAAGRLLQAAFYAGVNNFEYDASGNRKTTFDGSSNRTYATAATSNRISSITNPSQSFTYDSAGNTQANGRFSATFDLTGRMSTLAKAGVTSTYKFDPLGHRVRKHSSVGPASTVVFFYDQEGHLLGEYDQNGKAVREFIWMGDIPVAMFTTDPTNAANPPLVYFIHTDHLNTPRVVLDRNNKIRWRWISDPFGLAAAETNPSGLGNFTFNLRFPGQYFDQESGPHQNWHREYDPSIGGYTQSDPIGLAGGINTYAYVRGAPTNGIDPTGLYCSVSNGILSCTNPNGPTFNIPWQTGYPTNIDPSLPYYHTYMVKRPIRCASTTSVMNRILQTPTPTNWSPSNPATPGGTRNNARVWPRPNNWVTSYQTQDTKTGMPLEVNVTGDGSQFEPGYVVRWISDGVAYTAGEGQSFWQSNKVFRQWVTDGMNEHFWGDQLADFISQSQNPCQCR